MINNNMREYTLYSSQFASGLTWLYNFFLELDVFMCGPENLDEEWILIGSNRYGLTKKGEALQAFLPVLKDKKIIKNKEEFIVRWTHDLPYNNQRNKKTLLLIRDGRDAIFSQYCRFNRFDSCAEMLSEPMHMPIDMLPADLWALSYFMWLRFLSEEDALVVTFEDLKNNVRPTVDKIMNFFNIQRTEDEIENAINNCHVERAKKIGLEYREKNNIKAFQHILRRGVCNEAKGKFTDVEYSFFLGLPNIFLQQSGYKIPEVIHSRIDVKDTIDGIDTIEDFKKYETKIRREFDDEHISISRLEECAALLLCLEWSQKITNIYSLPQVSVFVFLERIMPLLVQNKFYIILSAKALHRNGYLKQSVRLINYVIPQLLYPPHKIYCAHTLASNGKLIAASVVIWSLGFKVFYQFLKKEVKRYLGGIKAALLPYLR